MVVKYGTNAVKLVLFVRIIMQKNYFLLYNQK